MAKAKADAAAAAAAPVAPPVDAAKAKEVIGENAVKNAAGANVGGGNLHKERGSDHFSVLDPLPPPPPKTY